MEDLNLKPKIENGNIKKNGVELPPPKSSKYSLEKEEN